MREYSALIITPSDEELADAAAAIVDDYEPLAADETADGLRIFFPTPEARDAAMTALRAHLPRAMISRQQVPDENWAERSQASLKAVSVLGLTIAPPWDVDGKDPARTVVILPSMGFGTGHHATTCLCLRAMQEIGVAGTSLIDVGTGSGVLALAARKLGASRVVAVDNDPDAIANARENAELNSLSVDLRCGDLADAGVTSGAPFDRLMANLTGATLVRSAALLERLAPHGTLVVSGVREEEDASVRAAFSRTVRMRYELVGWLCLVF